MFTIEIEQGLELALVQRSFAAKYLEIVSREREYLSQWLVWPPHAHDEQFFDNFITKSLHDYADNKSLVCAIILNGEIVGNISFNSINQTLKKVEIGYWLSAQHQGKGIITKSLAKLITIAFIDLTMEKVEISVAVDNNASRKVCDRLGFELEEVISQAENLNGRIVDHGVYGLSKEQWSAP